MNLLSYDTQLLLTTILINNLLLKITDKQDVDKETPLDAQECGHIYIFFY